MKTAHENAAELSLSRLLYVSDRTSVLRGSVSDNNTAHDRVTHTTARHRGKHRRNSGAPSAKGEKIKTGDGRIIYQVLDTLLLPSFLFGSSLYLLCVVDNRSLDTIHNTKEDLTHSLESLVEQLAVTTTTTSFHKNNFSPLLD